MKLKIWISLLLAACGSDAPTGVDAPIDSAGPLSIEGFAVGTDYVSPGVGTRIFLSPFEAEENILPTGAVSSDPALRLLDQIYILNRFGADNITVVDKFSLEVVEQFSTGAGSNPQDIAVSEDSYYVASFDAPGVLVFSKSDTSARAEVIDLSMLDAVDGVPDCQSLYLKGTTLTVTCGVLDRSGMFWSERGPGQVAIIDTTTNTVTTTFSLTTNNPRTFLTPVGDELWIGTAPLANSVDGCVESISSTSASCEIPNATLGDAALKIIELDDGTVWISFSDGFSPEFKQLAGVMAFSSGSQARPTDFSSVHNPIDLALCSDGSVLASDQNAGGLIHFYADRTIAESVALPIGAPIISNGIVCM